MDRISIGIIRLAFVLVLGVLSGCGGDSDQPGSAPTSPGSSTVPVVVVLGDSLTAGPLLSQSQAYPALLESRARSAGYPHRFINAGVSGDTTADALRRFDNAIHQDTRVLVVALGANDGLQGVPINTIKSNLRQILDRARARNLKVLLAGMETPPSNGFQYSVDFHFIFPDIAREYEVPLMPFLLEGVFGNRELNLPDGLHPNAAGMRVIAETMWPYLEPLLQETK